MFLKSIKSLLFAKARTFLTMSGIAVGVFSVVLISAVGSIGTRQVSSAMISMGVDTLLVQAADNTVSVTLTDSDVSAVRTVEGVSDAMPLMSSITEAKMLGNRLDCWLWGVDSSADRLISLFAEHGRLITNADDTARAKVCVIDEQFALDTYGRRNVVGKKLTLFLGSRFHEFEIVGVAKSGLSAVQGMMSGVVPGFMYIPISTMQSLCGRTTYDKIAVKISDINADGRIVEKVVNKLNTINGLNDGYICNNLLSQKESLEEIMSIVTLALSLVAGISLFVSGISVMTTMMMSVSERTREIGIKKATGAKKRDICAEFLMQSVSLSLIGGAAGIAAGILVALAGCTVLKVPFMLNSAYLVISIAATIGVGTVFGVYPALKAAGLNPAEALRG